MSITVRRATVADRDAILAVHRAAAVTPGALARTPEEVTPANAEAAIAADVCLVAVDADGTVCGEIHAKRETIALFAHVLGGLTVAVRPDYQGRGVGSKLFEMLIAWARSAEPEVVRIELAAGAGNASSGQGSETLRASVKSSMITVDGVLHRLSLTIGQCSRFEVGQLIELPEVDTTRVSLRAETVNGHADIGLCEMGVWKNQRALKLTTPIHEPFTRELANL
jgi:putative acetyltransferase